MNYRTFNNPGSHLIGGLDIRSAGLKEATQFIQDSVVEGHAAHVHFVNAYSIICAAEDSNVKNALSCGGINYPDGKPLRWIGRYMRHDRNFSQIRGPASFEKSLRESDPKIRHFFLGGAPEVLEKLVEVARNVNPTINIAGVDSPPFIPLDETEINRRNRIILASGANLVWVGLGTPKQDLEARRIAEELGITAVAVGAAFNFLAGDLREAPAWMRDLGLEWLYRFLMEPKRLWKRYLLGNFKFLWIVMNVRKKRVD